MIFPGRASVLVLALAAAVSLTACSSSSASPGQTTAAAVTACQQASPARLPAAGGQQPGDIRWSASLARCARNSGQQWTSNGLTSPTTWAAPTPGNRLAVIVNGVASMYSTATGARLWRRSVAPAGHAGFQTLDASASLMMIQFRTDAATLTTFLDASTGRPLGKINTSVPGDPFLVGTHVVVSNKSNQLEGYDPATAKALWQVAVPDAPDAGSEVNDGTIVYLNSETGGEHMPPMRQIDRLDAATGRLLTPLTLPQPLAFDLSAGGGNNFDQGLLLLGVDSPATRTVAVDPASGAVKWSYPGNVVSGPGLFMYFDQGGSAIATISPDTGRQVWSSQQQALGSGGGDDPLLATLSYVAAWAQVTATRWMVAGFRPDGSRAWTSPRFPNAVFLANDARTVYVIGCTAWDGSQSGVCSDITLTAIAA